MSTAVVAVGGFGAPHAVQSGVKFASLTPDGTPQQPPRHVEGPTSPRTGTLHIAFGCVSLVRLIAAHQIAASAEEDPKTAEAFLAHRHQPPQEGDAKPQWVDPVKPLTAEEEVSRWHIGTVQEVGECTASVRGAARAVDLFSWVPPASLSTPGWPLPACIAANLLTAAVEGVLAQLRAAAQQDVRPARSRRGQGRALARHRYRRLMDRPGEPVARWWRQWRPPWRQQRAPGPIAAATAARGLSDCRYIRSGGNKQSHKVESVVLPGQAAPACRLRPAGAWLCDGCVTPD